MIFQQTKEKTRRKRMKTQINNSNVLSDETLKMSEILEQNPLFRKAIIEAVAKCKGEFSTVELQHLSFPYEIEDLAYKKPTLPDLNEDILKRIRFNEFTSSSHQFKAVIETEDLGEEYGVMLTAEFSMGKDIKLLLPLTERQSKEFCLAVKTGKYTCEGEIRYSSNSKKFSVHNLKIYIYKDIEGVYKKEISSFGNFLKDRMDNFLIKFGYSPEKMTLLEKNIIFLRLVALVQKKYVLIDISKPEIGKSFTYKSLGINLYSVCITRSTAFYNINLKQLGDFYKEPIIYVADEFPEILDVEFFSNLLVYKNGEGKIGDFQSSGTNRKSSNSVALLGNPKIANVDYFYIYLYRINLLEKTKINEIPSSFLSKMDSLLPSYGCRTLDKMRKDNKYDLDPDFKEVFTTVLTELREKNINVAELLKKHNISSEIGTARDRSSILNTVEGLIKILYPEVIDNESQNIPKEVLEYFLYTAVMVRQTLNNQRAIREGKGYDSLAEIPSSYRNAYFNYSKVSVYYTPHRAFIKRHDGKVEKEPLDAVGIEFNKKEYELLKSRGCNIELKNNGNLIHDDFYIPDVPRLGQYSYAVSNQTTIPPFSVNYNYLIGEKEKQDEESIKFLINNSLICGL